MIDCIRLTRALNHLLNGNRFAGAEALPSGSVHMKIGDLTTHRPPEAWSLHVCAGSGVGGMGLTQPCQCVL